MVWNNTMVMICIQIIYTVKFLGLLQQRVKGDTQLEESLISPTFDLTRLGMHMITVTTAHNYIKLTI